jgi:chitinase
MSVWAFFAFFSLFLSLSVRGSAEQCGRQAGDALCPGGLCCSFYGWCGTTVDYCGDGCQSQCDGGDGCDGGGGGGGDGDDGYLSDIIPKSTFDALLKFRNDPRCHAVGFYTYDAFISAAKEFPDFGNTGDDLMRKREIAAFLGQTSHETTGRVLFFLYNFLLVTSINVI